MRLVDADKLIELFSLYISEDKKVAYQPRQLKIDDIRNAPTVNAIPIEWINMWLLKRVFIWEATTMANEKDRLQAIENIKYGFEEMLKDWEEENER